MSGAGHSAALARADFKNEWPQLAEARHSFSDIGLAPDAVWRFDGLPDACYDFGVAKAMLGYADGGKNVKGVSAGFVAPVAGFNIGAMYGKNSETSVKGTGFSVGMIYTF